jgi:putative pyruvate formate lyase activating enzyme
MWEEPIISGTRGSGTVFFTGCSLGCIYCQNSKISTGQGGRPVTEEELASIMLELERDGAHNINLVTPTHFTPSIISAVKIARDKGLSVPIVYNTGTYDTVENIKSLEGTVQIYLPDLKYYRPETAKKLSFASDYVAVARDCICEMVRQTGAPKLSASGLLESGTVVRVLLLPGHLAEAKLSVKYLYSTYGDSIYISLMSQYTPKNNCPAPLDRRVTQAEYGELVDYAARLGVTNAFTQELSSALESFIPDFE